MKFAGKQFLGKLEYARNLLEYKISVPYQSFIFANERIDLENKICIVIPSRDNEHRWFPARFGFYFAGEILPVREFVFRMESLRADADFIFSKQYLDFTFHQK